MTCQRGGSLSLTTRDIVLKECRTVSTLKYLLRKLFNRLHYILNDPRTSDTVSTFLDLKLLISSDIITT